MSENLNMASCLPSPLKKTKIEMPSLPDIVLPETLPNKPNAEIKRSRSDLFYRPASATLGTSPSPNAVLGLQKPKTESGTSLKDAIVSKRTMPKLYSRKVKMNDTSITDGVPRLIDLCLKVLCNNIDLIDEVGDLPYFVLKGVLDRCTPVQLMRIESHNPHLIDDTDKLWEGFCKKEFKLLLDVKPAEESWCEYYVRLCQQRDHKLQQLKLKVNEHLVQAESPKRKTKLTCAISKPASRRRGLQTSTSTVAPVLKSTLFPTKEPSIPMPSRPLTSYHTLQQVGSASAPKRVKTVAPEEPAVIIPSRAEILAKRGLKTLNDPKVFKGQPLQSATSASTHPPSVPNTSVDNITSNVKIANWSSTLAKLKAGMNCEKRSENSVSSSIRPNSMKDLASMSSHKMRMSLVGNATPGYSAYSKTEKPKTNEMMKIHSKSDYSKINSVIKSKSSEKSKSAEMKPRKRMFDS